MKHLDPSSFRKTTAYDEMTPVMNWELRLSQSYGGGMLIRLTFSDSCDNIQITEVKKNAASETPCKYDTTCPWYKKGLTTRVLSLPMLSWKLSALEIPLDKELTANCLVETRTKLEEPIPAVKV